MKKAVLAAVLGSSITMVAPARAEIGTIDAVPAATLLLPYFEVDLANVNGVTTLLSINNSSATAVLAHVTVWSKVGVATLAFNVYLTGYDVQTVNMRDIMNGVLPQTASDGQDPADTNSPTDGISNQGEFSQDINFASCNGQLPLPTALDSIYIAHIQAAHTGQPSPIFGTCASPRSNPPETVAKGYVTVDTVNNCTLQIASDPGYFGSGGSGSATNQNVLWGDYFYVNPTQNFAQGDTLVHIEASATNPQTTGSGQYTFYGRMHSFSGIDNREPLATNFAARFLAGGAFTGGTDLLVWRDPKRLVAPFSCNLQFPNGFPLNQTQVLFFDEQENADVPPEPPVFPPPPADPLPFPLAAQRVSVNNSAELQTVFSLGWVFLDLNTTVSGQTGPAEDAAAAQAWVTQTHSAAGRFSVGYSAVQLDSATTARHQPIGAF
jgi:hypothetical protein